MKLITTSNIMKDKLPTDPYKGVRDLYPEDMAIQRYIFDVWSMTAESFGYEQYDASVLEPAELYKAKGAENEEMVNEQTYTFEDRGGREVTLRPEMTPTVARMIAAKQKAVAFPVRWYSIPNLFRYERTQRGRLREHWQFNCDIFGSDDIAADVEIISLAYHTLINFGATPEMFEIRINDREEMTSLYSEIGINSNEIQNEITRLNDRFNKLSESDYKESLLDIVKDDNLVKQVYELISGKSDDTNSVLEALNKIGITNVKIDRSIARGFNYYTGTIFEIFDTSDENNRALLGGGRYNNLTSLFSDEPVSGVGFGMGDVTMRDFLNTHNLLPDLSSSPHMLVIPTDSMHNVTGEKIAQAFRAQGINVLVDISTKNLNKKISAASESGATYMIVVGDNEALSNKYTVKNLKDGTEMSATLDELKDQIL